MARSGSGGHCTRSNGLFAASGMSAAYTVAGFIQGNAVPTTGAFHDAWGVRNNASGSSQPDGGFRWDHLSSSAGTRTVIHREASTTYRTAQMATSLSANTWYHIAEWWDGTNLKCFLNGVQDATIAAAAGFNGTFYVNQLAQACDTVNGISNQWPGGIVGDVAMWKVALDAAELNALALGFSPRLVRPASRIYWAENVHNNVEWHQGVLNLGATTAVFTEHPRRFG